MLVLISTQDNFRKFKSAIGELLSVLRIWKKMCDYCHSSFGLHHGYSVCVYWVVVVVVVIISITCVAQGCVLEEHLLR